MQNETIRSLLKTLQCYGVLNQWEEIMEVLTLQPKDNLTFLQNLLEIEAAYRQTRALLYRLSVARLPQIKLLTEFDLPRHTGRARDP